MPGCDDEEQEESPGAGEKHDPDESQLQCERSEGRRGVKQGGKLVRVPADPRRERAVLVILVHCGEVAPLRVAARDLCDAGLEVDAEEFPLQEKQTGTRRRMGSPPSGTDPWRREEEPEETGFEEHAVRLVAGKFSRGADEGKKTEEANHEHGAWPEVQREQKRRKHAGPAEGHKHV